MGLGPSVTPAQVQAAQEAADEAAWIAEQQKGAAEVAANIAKSKKTTDWSALATLAAKATAKTAAAPKKGAPRKGAPRKSTVPKMTTAPWHKAAWVMPVGIGVAALLALVVLKKRTP